MVKYVKIFYSENNQPMDNAIVVDYLSKQALYDELEKQDPTIDPNVFSFVLIAEEDFIEIAAKMGFVKDTEIKCLLCEHWFLLSKTIIDSNTGNRCCRECAVEYDIPEH